MDKILSNYCIKGDTIITSRVGRHRSVRRPVLVWVASLAKYSFITPLTRKKNSTPNPHTFADNFVTQEYLELKFFLSSETR